MKLSNLTRTLSKNKLFVILIVIMLVGAFLRFYNLQARSGFDADQEQLAYKAQEILKGDPALLGPTTSLGRFAIGPGFSYLWAIFAFFMHGDPAAGAYLSVFLGLLTIIGFYVLGKYLFNEKIGIVASIFYSLSLVNIVWDQNPWAPSLFFISELLVLFGAYMSTKKPIYLAFVALGIILGFQAHFGIFLVVVGIFAFWIFYRPKLTKKSFLIFIGILVGGFLPNLVYDLANNFVNSKRLLQVFSQSTAGGIVGFDRVVSTISYSFFSVIQPYPNKNYALFFFVLVMPLAFFFYYKRGKYSSQICLLLSTILVPALLFMVFRGNFSEYYLMMTIPPFILLFSYLSYSVLKDYPYIFATLVFVFCYVNVRQVFLYKRSLSLEAKKKVVSYVVDKAGRSGYGVSLTTKLGYDFGYRYIFSYYKATPDIPPLKGQEKIFTIASPDGYDGVRGKIDYDGIGVLWQGFDF